MKYYFLKGVLHQHCNQSREIMLELLKVAVHISSHTLEYEIPDTITNRGKTHYSLYSRQIDEDFNNVLNKIPSCN